MNISGMLVTDCLLFGALGYLSYMLVRMILLLRSKPRCRVGSREFYHFFEHLTAALVALVGSGSSAILKAAHTLMPQPVGLDLTVEILMNVSFTILAISGIIFVAHVTKEETDGHQFSYHDKRGRRRDDSCGEDSHGRLT